MLVLLAPAQNTVAGVIFIIFLYIIYVIDTYKTRAYILSGDEIHMSAQIIDPNLGGFSVKAPKLLK